jgi:hypothetical protein
LDYNPFGGEVIRPFRLRRSVLSTPGSNPRMMEMAAAASASTETLRRQGSGR